MTLADEPPICRVEWEGAVRIIRSVYPPIDLFEDIADPATGVRFPRLFFLNALVAVMIR